MPWWLLFEELYKLRRVVSRLPGLSAKVVTSIYGTRCCDSAIPVNDHMAAAEAWEGGDAAELIHQDY
ncbi:hypothetical protein TSMEX_000276 [Taenia solium]|eukprot:TsM_001054900 transcript=TsM_001054900 gene=TsM_001054900